MRNTSNSAEMRPTPIAERRRSPRESIEVRARVSVASTSGVTTICHGSGTNLSDRGMAIHLPLE
jgi:hypothetical protein